MKAEYGSRPKKKNLALGIRKMGRMRKDLKMVIPTLMRFYGAPLRKWAYQIPESKRREFSTANLNFGPWKIVATRNHLGVTWELNYKAHTRFYSQTDQFQQPPLGCVKEEWLALEDLSVGLERIFPETAKDLKPFYDVLDVDI